VDCRIVDDMKLKEILRKTEPNAIIRDLADFVVNPNLGGLNPRHAKNAPLMVKQVLGIYAFHQTICSSGIYKWLVEIYDDDPELAQVLASIGAKRAAEYVNEAISLFPKGCIFESLNARVNFCDEHEDELDRLDEMFKGAAEESVLKLRDHIAENDEAFKKQVHIFSETRQHDEN
jgi:hypothetical protein